MSKDIVIKEYLGNGIEFKMIDGKIYANATSFNEPQKLANWKRSEKTKELIEELSNMQNLHISKELIISERGQGENSGTWIHEDLLLDLAQYISVKFRVWINTQIATLIREGSVSLVIPSYQIENPIDRAKKWIEEEERQRLALDNKKLTTEVIHKEGVIVGLVGNISLAEKRQRITQIVRYGAKDNYQERYRLLYSEVEKKIHINLKRRMDSEFAKSIKPKIKNKMDLLERGIEINGVVKNFIPETYEIACKLFENSLKELMLEWEDTISK